MADKGHSALPAPPLCSPSRQNGGVRGVAPLSHHNGTLLKETSHPHHSHAPPVHLSQSASCSVTPASGPDCGALRGQSVPSGSGPRTRPKSPRSKLRSVHQVETDALLDLILESQGQRLEEQRASVSLLPDPGPAAPCGTCSSQQDPLSLDFYCMLIHYQSDRMDDQRSSLPDPDEVVGSVPDQEDFFSLVQRVQSRRMDEQRASALLSHTHTHCESAPCCVSSRGRSSSSPLHQ